PRLGAAALRWLTAPKADGTGGGRAGGWRHRRRPTAPEAAAGAGPPAPAGRPTPRGRLQRRRVDADMPSGPGLLPEAPARGRAAPAGLGGKLDADREPASVRRRARPGRRR